MIDRLMRGVRQAGGLPVLPAGQVNDVLPKRGSNATTIDFVKKQRLKPDF
jgi:hypothetical protein